MTFRLLGLVFSIAFSGACGILGYGAAQWYLQLPFWVTPPAVTPDYSPAFGQFITLAFVALGLLVGFSLASVIYRQVSSLATNLAAIPGQDKVAALIGLLIGLIVAGLLRPFFDAIANKVQFVQPALLALVYLLCIYGGIALALGMKNELSFLLTRPSRGGDKTSPEPKLVPKLIDTNVIIDGRIADICRAGFIEGTIYVPGFVLEELHLIADSSDNLRRARGRRGLDILAQLQKDNKQIQIYDHYKTPMPRSEAVDAKLVKLAKELKARIITNDFNLNKVASLQGISVLNINELASALKPVVLPGEELKVTIVREGKELNQGVAYLDDGTMVVVEGAKPHINESVWVIVSSVLQTVAGKMIFANLKSASSENSSSGGNAHASDDHGYNRHQNRDSAANYRH